MSCYSISELCRIWHFSVITVLVCASTYSSKCLLWVRTTHHRVVNISFALLPLKSLKKCIPPFRKLVWIYSSSATFIWVLQYFHYPQCGKSALHKTFKLVPRLLKLWPCAQADIFYKRSGYTSNASILLKNASCCCIVPGSSWVFPGSACPVWEGVSAHTYQSPVFGFWECLWYPWREWAGQKQRKGKVWKAGHFFCTA